jgi:hypothetical protein
MQALLQNVDITFGGENSISHQLDDSRILSLFLMTFMGEKLKLQCDSSIPLSVRLSFPLHFSCEAD